MKQFITSILILVLSTIGLCAQTDFRRGHIITLNSDTVYGEINYSNEGKLNQVCYFRSPAGEIVEYTPEELTGYRFDNSKYYVSKEFEGEKSSNS